MGPLLYDINSAWAGKTEPPGAVGSKFLETLEALGRIRPSFKGWASSDDDESDDYPIESIRDRIGEWVIAHPPPNEEPAPWQSGIGCWVYAVSDRGLGDGPSRQAEFHVRAGSTYRNYNHFEVGASLDPPDLSFITFPLYKAALLTMVSIWPAPWASARCSIWGEQPSTLAGEPPFPYSAFQMPWIAYLNAERAATVDVPPSVSTERAPDGGLLMVATEARFDPTNVQHMRASRLIAQIMIEHADEP